MGSHPGGAVPQGSGRRLAWGLGIAGAGLLAFSASAITGFVGAFARRAPIVTWDDGGWAALPIGMALLALATGLHIGRREGPDVDGPRAAAIRRLLVLSACLLPFVVVLPLGARWIAASQLEARGYADCGDGRWQRAAATGNGTPECESSRRTD